MDPNDVGYLLDEEKKRHQNLLLRDFMECSHEKKLLATASFFLKAHLII